jgi:hypothetical protein
MPGTTAPEAEALEKVPVISPNDLAPILTGFIGLWTGKGAYGQDIRATSKSDLVGKYVANVVGFFSPPMVQKYLFNMTSPRENTIAGINTYRMEQDLGNVINPMTGKPGSWLADAVINNSVMKNYASSGEQYLHNQELHKSRTVDKVRSELSKRFSASVRSGAPDEANKYLLEIFNTFIKEYTPGAVAQEKWSEWLIRHRRLIMMHPQLRRYSEEDLIRFLIENNKAQSGNRNEGMNQILSAMRRELAMRNATP